MKKIIAIGITGILLLTASISLAAEEQKTETAGSSGGYIQSRIDAANPGDTIYIPSGTYYENLVIYKPITLMGEDKETTIIDGGGSGNVVFTEKTDTETVIKITGFTIRNGNRGIQADYTGKLHIIGNNIIENEIGINLSISRGCTIDNNSFIDNVKNVYFEVFLFFPIFPRNNWNGNYWDNWQLRIPKPIVGKLVFIIILRPAWIIKIPLLPLFNFDWHPTQEPYDRGG